MKDGGGGGTFVRIQEKIIIVYIIGIKVQYYYKSPFLFEFFCPSDTTSTTSGSLSSMFITWSGFSDVTGDFDQHMKVKEYYVSIGKIS